MSNAAFAATPSQPPRPSRPTPSGRQDWRPSVIVSDIDGTLIDPAERVTPGTRAVIQQAVQGGARLILASGRPPRWIRPIAEQLGIFSWAVCANGGVIYDVAADTVLGAEVLPAELVLRLVADIGAALPEAGFAAEGIVLGGRAAESVFVAAPDYEHAWPDPDHLSVQHAELVARPVVKLLVRNQHLRSAELARLVTPIVGDQATITFSTDEGLVELSSPGVSKAHGLRYLGDLLGFTAADVVAFGDMPNDLEMLRWVGHGVAMGNARPEVRAAAAETTGTNEEDGVAAVLRRWWP